jgi:hypothetical protein
MVIADGRAHTGQAFRLGRVAVEPGRTPQKLPGFTVEVSAKTVGFPNDPYGRGLAQGAASRA